MSVFQVLFKANLIFKDFKTVLYIQVLFKPVRTLFMTDAFSHLKKEYTLTLRILMNSSTWFETMSLRGFIVHIKVF